MVHRAERLWLREFVPPPVPPPKSKDPEDEDPIPGIRCPSCAWQPRPSNLWLCTCGKTWNTFATRGRCPRCRRQWRDTRCLSCRLWSLHLDWYIPPSPRA